MVISVLLTQIIAIVCFFSLAVLRFEHSEYHVAESQATFTIRILLNVPATTEVALSLEAKDNTATSEKLNICAFCNSAILFQYTIFSTHNNALVGLDYENPKQHKLIIPPGSISTTATIIIVNDHTSEPTEEFKLTIVPEGVMQLIPQAEAVIYIMDDECELFFVHTWFLYVTMCTV